MRDVSNKSDGSETYDMMRDAYGSYGYGAGPIPDGPGDRDELGLDIQFAQASLLRGASAVSGARAARDGPLPGTGREESAAGANAALLHDENYKGVEVDATPDTRGTNGSNGSNGHAAHHEPVTGDSKTLHHHKSVRMAANERDSELDLKID